MKRAGVVLAALGVLAVTTAGCKRRKPPTLDRVWLGPSRGCALEKNAGLSCWGKNDRGQLGDGTKQDRTFATRTTSRDRPDALAIARDSTCGLYAGAVRCTGVEPPKELPAGGFTAIAATGHQICALHPDGPTCWDVGATKSDLASPDRVAWLKGARMLAAGDAFFCAAFAEPKLVRCTDVVGWAAYGFGAGELNHQPPPRPELLKGADVVSLAVGGAHACAALADGSATCWGENKYGQLGDGSTARAAAPVSVVGIAGVASIHAGDAHTCARLRNGTVACWGDNRRYQLANGTTEPRSVPGAMFGLAGVQELALAGDSSCARLSDGMVKCWGRNDVGQLGDGSTFDNSVPASIRWNAADGATR